METVTCAMSKVMGAGIVPVSLCPSTGAPHLLLGTERFVHGWSCSNKVSGFEGGNKYGENTEHNAARECQEETLGLVYASKEECLSDLVNGKFIMCISNGFRSKSHVTYVTLVPWIDNISVKFNEVRTFLMELDTVSKKFDSVRSRLRKMRMSALEEGQRTFSCILNNEMRIRSKLEQMLFASPHASHPAISVLRDTDGTLKRVTVNTDYLEKSDMQYISIPSALDMMTHKRSTLRPLFQPILGVICANLSLVRISPGMQVASRRDSLRICSSQLTSIL